MSNRNLVYATPFPQRSPRRITDTSTGISTGQPGIRRLVLCLGDTKAANVRPLLKMVKMAAADVYLAVACPAAGQPMVTTTTTGWDTMPKVTAVLAHLSFAGAFLASRQDHRNAEYYTWQLPRHILMLLRGHSVMDGDIGR